ncbi:DUF1499 domain-containing protein [Rubritalea spongiae]|uniref:DUF1499 domain-containing protein n=1 Tax=Rubritalea spongiae TaxID=430797 RepID=A0ABW5E2J7_9BACT
MSSILELLAVATGGGVLSLKLLAVWSHTRNAARGIIDGKLAPNNPSPNSVCSEGETANITPLEVKEHDAWENLQDAIESLSGRFMSIQQDYLHAVFKTALWGFEEDLEARFDRDANVIHLRSASRVGYSDMGTNRKRVETLKRLLE